MLKDGIKKYYVTECIPYELPLLVFGGTNNFYKMIALNSSDITIQLDVNKIFLKYNPF